MKKLLVATLAFAPVFAFAQQPGNLGNVDTFLNSIQRLINLALPIVVGIALLGFFWGLARFVFKSSDPGAQAEARSMMIWSVIALFVMVSVWGLVNFLGQTLGIQGQSAPAVPTVPTGRI